jgi:hypothetical protein
MSEATHVTGSAGETHTAFSRRKRPGCLDHPRLRPGITMSASESSPPERESVTGSVESESYTQETVYRLLASQCELIRDYALLKDVDDAERVERHLRRASRLSALTAEIADEYLEDADPLSLVENDGGDTTE